MKCRRRALTGAGLFIALPLCVLLIAGCAQPNTAGPGSAGSPPSGTSGSDKMAGSDKMEGGPGRGPGGGGGGGRGGPVAENASGAEIYQAKCGCHGPDGKGKNRAPALTGSSGDSDAKLTSIIHDGKEKMPAFGSQLSDAQIKKVVTFIKKFKS